MGAKGELFFWAKKEYKIADFDDFIITVSKLKNHFTNDLMLFRGQPCDRPLLPSLGRPEIIDNVLDIKEFEEELFDDFKKRYIAYSRIKCDNHWDLLALGQHHGMPTRLMDWTESALVALWFATEQDDDKGVVYIIFPEKSDIINVEQKDNDSPFTRRSTKFFCPNHISNRITAQSGCLVVMQKIRKIHFLSLKH